MPASNLPLFGLPVPHGWVSTGQHGRVNEFPPTPPEEAAVKERALARTTPIVAAPGRYQPTDTIMAFLDNL